MMSPGWLAALNNDSIPACHELATLSVQREMHARHAAALRLGRVERLGRLQQVWWPEELTAGLPLSKTLHLSAGSASATSSTKRSMADVPASQGPRTCHADVFARALNNARRFRTSNSSLQTDTPNPKDQTQDTNPTAVCEARCLYQSV